MILVCYGTRPEWIKLKPVIDGLDGVVPFKVLFTGQHEDMANFEHDYRLEIKDGENRLDSIVQSILNQDIFDSCTHVMIQGDTTSCLAVSLAAFHRQKKIIHLEAGLRTYDFKNPYPEEMNRQLISRMSDVQLCPTEWNLKCLEDEKAGGDKYVVGNTVLDTIDRSGCVYGNKVLVTLHRRENHEILDKYFNQINELAESFPDLEFILPIHPNPNVLKYKHLIPSVTIIEPLGRDELLKLLKECKLVISDSGGIQEECSFLNKKVIVCRKITERPESVGIHSFMCGDPANLITLFEELIVNCEVDEPCAYGDGKSTERIINILKDVTK